MFQVVFFAVGVRANPVGAANGDPAPGADDEMAAILAQNRPRRVWLAVSSFNPTNEAQETKVVDGLQLPSELRDAETVFDSILPKLEDSVDGADLGDVGL